MKQTIKFLALAGCVAMLTSGASAYGFYQRSHGRADYANRYDLNGSNYPAQAGYTYDFGKIGAFNALPPGVNAALALQSVQDASNKWASWAAIQHDTTAFGANNTGLVRLVYDPLKPSGAVTSGYGAGGNNFATITFGVKASGAVAWNADNFKWVMFHEMGHTLGLDDLYVNYAEEFVDHEVNAGAPAVKTPSAYRDNVMNQYNAAGNNYAQLPSTIVDNDEIAGLTWLWGSALNTSQIVTGDLDNAWNGQAGRDTPEHHGNRTGGWWTYRGSVSVQPGGDAGQKPLIDIQFPGYTGDFEGASYGAGGGNNIEYVGHQGNSVHRFRINSVGFTGNFRLKLKSRYTTETRVPAWVMNAGGGWDDFELNPNLDDAVFLAPSHYVKVFGPVPEPGTMLALGLGVVGLCLRRRKRS